MAHSHGAILAYEDALDKLDEAIEILKKTQDAAYEEFRKWDKKNWDVGRHLTDGEYRGYANSIKILGGKQE